MDSTAVGYFSSSLFVSLEINICLCGNKM